jgi:hypothetical protein
MTIGMERQRGLIAALAGRFEGGGGGKPIPFVPAAKQEVPVCHLPQRIGAQLGIEGRGAECQGRVRRLQTAVPIHERRHAGEPKLGQQDAFYVPHLAGTFAHALELGGRGFKLAHQPVDQTELFSHLELRRRSAGVRKTGGQIQRLDKSVNRLVESVAARASLSQ